MAFVVSGSPSSAFTVMLPVASPGVPLNCRSAKTVFMSLTVPSILYPREVSAIPALYSPSPTSNLPALAINSTTRLLLSTSPTCIPPNSTNLPATAVASDGIVTEALLCISKAMVFDVLRGSAPSCPSVVTVTVNSPLASPDTPVIFSLLSCSFIAFRLPEISETISPSNSILPFAASNVAVRVCAGS